MAVITPFQVAAYPFFRDMLFFVGAVAFLAYTAWDQRIALFEGIILIAYYLLYVTIVVAGGWLRQRYATRFSPLIESEAESPVLTTHEDEHNQYGEELFDEYSQTQPLLGKTPTTERPRLFGIPLTTDEVGVSNPPLLMRPLKPSHKHVTWALEEDLGLDEQLISRATNLVVAQSSLMFRKRIQHHRRKSFLGAFEFRDAIQSWKHGDPRPNTFSAVEGFSPTRPRPPRCHRRERSNASFDPACGRVVERPVFVRCSTYTGDNSADQTASAAVSQGFSRGGSPLQSAFPRVSPLIREPERPVADEAENSAPPRLPALDGSPEHAPTAGPSISVSTPGGGPRTPLSIDTSRFWMRPSRAPRTPDEHSQVESAGPAREAPPSSPLRLVLLHTPSIPEDNVVATDYLPGVHAAPVEEEVAGLPSASAAAAAAARPLKDILFPHLTEWRYRSLSSKIAGLIATPLVFLLIITVPVVDDDAEDKTPPAKGTDPEQDLLPSERTASYNGTEVTVVDDDEVRQKLFALKWNRGLTVAQFAVAPPFVSSALLGTNIPQLRRQPFAPIQRGGDRDYCRLDQQHHVLLVDFDAQSSGMVPIFVLRRLRRRHRLDLFRGERGRRPSASVRTHFGPQRGHRGAYRFRHGQQPR
ncbi:MAG: hypothetical protein BJ554DRAFT_2338 [Olpidium bornovanus]|uniref:Uncharacterized protein n=1 Tax=Olpidium bornovanus TaxID=278681 RepID=A0A8H8A117_9FUNG|nr:MAG: hypothetical protein BJ554DRAFT_2338 [Olpidium bornovanus]